MTYHDQPWGRLSRIVAAMPLLCLLLFAVVAQAQTFTVLHNFTNGLDGAHPYTGLTIDRAGNLYGTASTVALRLTIAISSAAAARSLSWSIRVQASFFARCTNSKAFPAAMERTRRDA